MMRWRTREERVAAMLRVVKLVVGIAWAGQSHLVLVKKAAQRS